MTRSTILTVLCLVFVTFSFMPSLYDLYMAKRLPGDRAFVLEHNYMFDFNFYLSRIREGSEGRYLVVEKYYNEPHSGSLLQIVYLYLGKFGNLFHLSPPAIYHLSRLVFGFLLLFVTSRLALRLLPGWFAVVAFLFAVTAGSYPKPVWFHGFWRFATYMGWWSVIDPLQRITFIPHILLGQIGLLVLVGYLGGRNKTIRLPILWGVVGFFIGIIFPPTLVVIYTLFAVITSIELVTLLTEKENRQRIRIVSYFYSSVFGRIVFGILSVPALLYLQLQFKILPWSALSLFDIQHRIILPYNEYYLALGPMLPLGILGGILALFRRERKLFPYVAWIASVFLLFKIFENVPQQSPSRFTEAAIHIPLGFLAGYLFYLAVSFMQKIKFLPAIGREISVKVLYVLMSLIILAGTGVMGSMVLWLSDQVVWKQLATWPVPIGAELAYPLKDFMDAIYFLRDNTNKNAVVFTYITAGNYIPAYAGNFVYIGHANTPDEDGKEKISARFFKGDMNIEEAKSLLAMNHVSYVYYGPQELALGNISGLQTKYPFLNPIYNNPHVTIYTVDSH